MELKDFLKKIRAKWHGDIHGLYAIKSFLHNEFLTKNLGGGIEEVPQYQYFKQLHDLLSVFDVKDSSFHKQRVGCKNDGGYVMIYPFSSNKIAYSFGINRDTSWDHDMAEHGYNVYQYDHTIRKLPENNERFHWKKFGITGCEETHVLKKLETLLCENHHENISGMVLKMDVEGAEWDVFTHTPAVILSQFDQIVAELHEILVGENFERILTALRAVSENFVAIHIHSNNCCERCAYLGQFFVPDTLEVTFVNKKKFDVVRKENAIFPTVEDQPNNPLREEIILGKW